MVKINPTRRINSASHSELKYAPNDGHVAGRESIVWFLHGPVDDYPPGGRSFSMT